MSAGREVPGALAWGLVAKVLVSVLAIASNVLIVRGLGDEGYGLYSLFLNISRFFVILIGLGQAQAILQYLPELRVHGDRRGARRLLATAAVAQGAAWVVIVLGAALAADGISRIYDADLGRILVLGTALLLFEVLWASAGNVLMAVRRMRALTLVSVVQRVALILLLLGLMRAGLTVVEVLWAVAACFLLSTLLLAGVVRRGVLPQSAAGDAAPDGDSAARSRLRLPLSRILRYTLPVTLGALTNQILWRSSEVLIVGYYWDARAAGFVNLAYNLPQMILEFVPLAIWPIILASLSELHSRRTEDLVRGVQLYFRLLFLLVLPPAVTGFVLGGQAYLVLYGAEMAPGAPLCQAFFLIFLFSFLVTPLRMALFVKERAMVNTWISLVGAAVNVGLDFYFIPRYGIWGAVPPVAIALVVSDLLQYVVNRRILPELDLPWAHLGRVLAGSAVVVPLWWLRSHIEGPWLLSAALIGGTLAQFLVLRAMRIVGDEERELLLRSNLPGKSFLVRWIAPRP